MKEVDTNAAQPPKHEGTIIELTGRRFVLRDGVWSDLAPVVTSSTAPAPKTIVVESYSTLYFELIRDHDWLAVCLARLPALRTVIASRVYEFSH